MESVKLSIVIINWNTCELLRQCLASICVPHMPVAYEIIVVDNASSDDSVNMLKKEYPVAKIIQNSANVGFARANNQAFECVQGEYVLLLNSDTIVQDVMTFTEWLNFMDTNADVGLSGCRLVFKNGKHQVGDAGYKPTLASVFFHSFFFSKLFPKWCRGIFLTADSCSTAQYVDWVCGACMLIRRLILKEIGGLDEQNFMYAEDVELGCRVRKKGYRVAYMPSIKNIHLRGGSEESNGKAASCIWLINLRRLYKQLNNYPLSEVLFNLVIGVGFLLRFSFYIVIGVVLSNKSSFSKSKEMFHYAKNCFFSTFVSMR